MHLEHIDNNFSATGNIEHREKSFFSNDKNHQQPETQKKTSSPATKKIKRHLNNKEGLLFQPQEPSIGTSSRLLPTT
jgi:hypothetical protein